MRIDVVTLFPSMIQAPLGDGLVGRAVAEGRASVHCTDPRTFTTDRHHTVDDTPYGGGAGMLMKPDVLAAAVAHVRALAPEPAWVVAMTPAGKPLGQAKLAALARRPRLVLVAGRYEGMDQRFLDTVDEELSIGDYVLTGGELAALVVIDGVVRLLPGTVGNPESVATDSFSAGLVEHAQYTRPPVFDALDVPEVLLGGDHARIAAYRRADALRRTAERRPELLAEVPLDPVDRATLEARPRPLRVGVLVVAPPGLADDPRALAALQAAIARLAVGYSLACVALVSVEPFEASPSNSGALDADPGPDREWPDGDSRRLRDARRGRERAAADARAAARASVSVGALPAATAHLDATLPGARWRALVVGAPVAETVGPAVARSEAATRGLVLVVGLPAARPELDTAIAARLEGFVRAPRADRAAGSLGLVAGLAVTLDRVIGER